ncbi:MAG: ABC transporter substrate-binding protein [Xanthobacter sp.]
MKQERGTQLKLRASTALAGGFASSLFASGLTGALALALGLTLSFGPVAGLTGGVAHAAASETAAKAPAKVKISYLPALYWALPFYIATEKGWWKEVGLDPSFVTFPAGAPQVAAAQAGSWDVGGTGAVPAVLGAARYGLVTVGVTNDESKANAMMADGGKVAELKANPQQLKGRQLLLTTNSTADYAARACLKKWGLEPNDMQFINLGQAQTISAMLSNPDNIVSGWAPYIYTLEEKAGAEILCSGADAGAVVPGTLVVRPEFAKQHPEEVAKILAVYVRAWGWAKAHPQEARAMAKRFYSEGGVEISDAAINQEFEQRPTFSLAEQQGLMTRDKGASELDGWLGRIGGFMSEVGTIPSAPDPKSFVDSSFMQRINDDPKLKAFATAFDPSN